MAWSRILLFSALAPSLVILAGAAEWNVINDSRITNRDTTPVLGRGFSVATGEVLSTCLITLPSHPTSDYDYFFTEISQDSRSNVGGMFQVAAGGVAAPVAGGITGGYAAANRTGTKVHFVSATMKIDRYYGSVDETKSPLVGAAQMLLQRNNYMQFFQACGPNYIRTIRRESRLTAVFKTKSTETVASNAWNIGGAIVSPFIGIGGHVVRRFSETQQNSKMTITIYAFGMSMGAANLGGNSMGGSGTLVVTGMHEFSNVMEIGFKSMQDSQGGIIKSVELVPWVNNAAFQIAADVNMPLSRNKYSCIRSSENPAVKVDIHSDNSTCYDMDDVDRTNENLNCGWTTHDIPVEKFNTTLCVNVGSEDVVAKEIRKFNLIANSEYLASIDSMIRQEMMSLNVHMSCVTRLLDFHSSYMDKKVFDHKDPTKNFDYLPDVLTVRSRLIFGDTYVNTNLGTRALMTSATNYKGLLGSGGLLHERKARAINRKIQSFVFPCYRNMQRKVFNVEQGMMYYKHWTQIDHCRKVKCTFSIMEWPEATPTNIPDDCTKMADDFLALDPFLESYCPTELHEWTTKAIRSDILGINLPHVAPTPPGELQEFNTSTTVRSND